MTADEILCRHRHRTPGLRGPPLGSRLRAIDRNSAWCH
jgi:hypothetical protein